MRAATANEVRRLFPHASKDTIAKADPCNGPVGKTLCEVFCDEATRKSEDRKKKFESMVLGAGVVGSKLERRFLVMWTRLGGPELEREVEFHPTRKWRFDFSISEINVAIEVEGGLWGNGRHGRSLGYAEDCRKYNAGVALGWTLFRFTTDFTSADLEPVIAFCRERFKK